MASLARPSPSSTTTSRRGRPSRRAMASGATVSGGAMMAPSTKRDRPRELQQVMRRRGDGAGGEHDAAEGEQRDRPQVEAEFAPAHRDAGRIDQRRQEHQQHQLRRQHRPAAGPGSAPRRRRRPPAGSTARCAAAAPPPRPAASTAIINSTVWKMAVMSKFGSRGAKARWVTPHHPHSAQSRASGNGALNCPSAPGRRGARDRRRPQITLDTMFTVSASTVTLKKNDSTPCMVATRRMRLAGDGDVGDLRGHADHQREIEEVPIVGVVVAGKIQAADDAVTTLAVIFVRVVQGEDRVHEDPRQQDRADRQAR